jgi:phosphatidylglycerophosphatase C
MERINWHKTQGHKVAVVSASIDYWLNDWCKLNGLDLISTTLELKNGKLTGRLSGKNCYGIEKVNRIKNRYNLAEFDQIYAYGNSAGDREMLLLASAPTRAKEGALSSYAEAQPASGALPPGFKK